MLLRERCLRPCAQLGFGIELLRQPRAAARVVYDLRAGQFHQHPRISFAKFRLFHSMRMRIAMPPFRFYSLSLDKTEKKRESAAYLLSSQR